MGRKMQILSESMVVVRAINRRADEVRGEGNMLKAKTFDDLSMGVALSAFKQTAPRKEYAHA
jgi:hypothetical protein